MDDTKKEQKGFEEQASPLTFEHPEILPLKKKKQSHAFEAALEAVQDMDSSDKHN